MRAYRLNWIHESSLMVSTVLKTAFGQTATAASGALWAVSKAVRVVSVRDYRSEIAQSHAAWLWAY